MLQDHSEIPLQTSTPTIAGLWNTKLVDESANESTTSNLGQQLETLIRMAASGSAKQFSRQDPRRQHPRIPFPFPIEVIPIGADGRVIEDETTSVIGRFLSCQGIDFYHKTTLPYSSYQLKLPCMDQQILITLKIHWSRSNQLGWLESGGRFLGLN